MGYKITYTENSKPQELTIDGDDIRFEVTRNTTVDLQLQLQEPITSGVQSTKLDLIWNALKNKTAKDIAVYLITGSTNQEILLVALPVIKNIQYNFQLNRNELDQNTSGIPLMKYLTIY